MVGERGVSLRDRETAREVKEKLGYVAIDYERELASPPTGGRDLPMGPVVPGAVTTA